MSGRLVVASSFPVDPPRGGGQRRIRGLYGALADLGVAAELVCLVDAGAPARRVELAPGLVEVDVPKTPAHAEAERELERAAGTVVTDVALALLHELTPGYGEALAAAAHGADAAVASHPYAHPALRAACDLPVIYEAHNVEADLKAPLLDATEGGRGVLADVERVEAACVAEAALVMACLDADVARLAERYALRAPVVVVPNGVDADAIRFTAPDARAALQDALGLDPPPAVFVGSWHGPNLEALDAVLAAAAAAPDVRFLVVGSVGASADPDAVPENVDVTGPVDDGFLRSILAVGHVALNPMTSGSGTNLKMLDYAAAGLPIVSTRFGARGLDLEPDVHYLAAEGDALGPALAGFDAAAAAARVDAARAHVAARFDWRAIAAGLAAAEPFRALAGTVVR